MKIETQAQANQIARDALNGDTRYSHSAIGAEDRNINSMESETGGSLSIRATNENEVAVYDLPDGSQIIVADANGPVAIEQNTEPTPKPRLTFTEQAGCFLYYSESTQGSESAEQAEMNVRLWNASPEMLKVLKTILAKAYLRPGKHEDYHVHPALIEAAKQLIASSGL